MAESLWTCVVEKVLEKIVSVVGEQIGVATGFNNALEKLNKELAEAENAINNATTKKTSHDNQLSKWVNDLQLIVDEANDVLDLIVYEDLRQKVKAQNKWKVPFSFCTCKYSPAFRLKRAKEIKEILGMLAEHMAKLPQLASLGDNTTETEIDINQLRETDSKFDNFEVVGRDVEVSSIVDRIIDAANKHVTSILPIVGIGGLGKTTLAKLVINHERIKEHFDKTIWVCVSQPFNVKKILGAILETLKDTPSGLEYSKEVLIGQLGKEMHGKTYFLVLDDVWNEEPSLWGELKNCLMKITENSGNSILVTTRSAEVAKIMETLPSHDLSKLSDDQCWSLFQESANANGLRMTPNLKVVRKELIKTIGGIPLVARVLGGAEQYLGDPNQWVTNLKILVSNSLQNENSAISTLKLSVDRLPKHSLKQCFAYCSNFPKDFEFKKEQLIQMWMAQGFIRLPKGRSNETIEDEGDRHFKILLRRGLFQDVVQYDRGRIISCKMHDLIHDIACDVSNDHKLQYSSDSLDGEVWTDENKKIASKLRTIIYCQDQMMPPIIERVIYEKMMNFVCLRVLMMNSKSIKELPDSIGTLKHLRYLDISGNSVSAIKLPKSIALLYSLQTLNIGGLLIEGLPENLTDLVNLRHLKFYPYHFVAYKMPPYFGKLTQLQTLSYFVVGSENGRKISELGLLKNLKGSLKLCFLEQVESKEEAKAAKLVEKENLEELEFEWSRPHLRKDNGSHNDYEILEGLQPHKNLQSLSIERAAIKSLPNNIFVENLAVISLRECQNCERLPMLGQLRNLKRLEVEGLHSVQSIGNEFYGNDCNQRTLFPKLKAFLLSDMKNLEQWEEAVTNLTTFPCLENLNIWRCPKLMNIPDVFGYCDENGVEHLRDVSISECHGLTKLPNGLQICHSIEDLRIEDCPNLRLSLQNKQRLSSLNIGGLHKLPEGITHLNSLEAMKISGCIQDYDFSPLMHLPSLAYLHLCDELRTATHIPQQLEHCTTLKFLTIENFEHIEALPEWFGNFTSLKRLGLYSCSNLKQLPSREAMLRLTKLRALYVDECPELQLGEGDTERAKLSHLPEIDVRLGYRVYNL